MVKRSVMIIEGKEVGGDKDQQKSWKMKRFLEEGSKDGEKLILLSAEKEQMRGAQMFKKRGEKFFRDMLSLI